MQTPPSPQRTPDSTPVANSGPGRVLLTDDGDAVRDVIRIYLEKRGLQVCGEAADGVEAIEKAKALKPDVIILDLAMPRMNGMEAAAVLSRIMPTVPIVLLTIYGDFVGASLAAVSGIQAVISKTDGLDKLATCVQSLLQASRQVAE
jgi:DNA-binding NarL/FixJ family response regulator